MKNLLAISATAICMLSFANPTPNFTVTGNVKGAKEGSYVYLEKQDSSGLKVKDSVKVLKEKFVFKGNANEPEIHLIQFKDAQGKIAFVLENGAITIDADVKDLSKSKVGGTFNNVELQKFNEKSSVINQKMQDFQAANTEAMKQAQINNDQAAVAKIMADFEMLRAEMVNLSTSYPEQNPKSYLSLLMLDNQFNQPKVEISKIKKDFTSLDEGLKNLKQGLALKAKIDNFRAIEIGSEAPHFSGPNPEGKTISLKESLGKVTLIDFWASWCGPCRKENPSVVAMYNELKAQGFKIIGVSLDKDKQKWIDAIAKDQLTWPQISNLQFWTEPIAVMYNVKSIPATFVLDKDGKIAAMNLRGEELKAKIIELLK